MKNPYRFYVYVYFYVNGIPFYVGLGSGSRITNHNWGCGQLSRTIKKYGGLPHLKVRENLTIEEAKETEIAFIAAIGRKDLGTGPLINRTNGGDGTVGRIVSDEVKERTRQANLGKKRSAAMRKKCSDRMKGCVPWNKGIPVAPESKIKMRDAKLGKPMHENTRKAIDASIAARGHGPMKGRTQSPESRQKMSDSQRGRKHTEEHRAKVALAGIGRVTSDETKQKLSNALRGREFSQESRDKMRESAKAAWARKRSKA